MNKITEYIKNHYIISGIALLAVVFIVFKVVKSNQVAHDLYTVAVGDVTQKVIVTGKTKAVHAVDLGFENSGKVAQSYVDVGSRVVAGQSLVSLDQSQVYADLLKAQANVASAQARLDELKKGTRPEEIAIAQTGVDNAKTVLADAQNNMSTKILDSYTKADDAIHNSIDAVFSNSRTNNPQINLVISDSQLKNDVNQGRADIETLINNWKANISDVSPAGVVKVDTNLGAIKAFIDKVSVVVNSQYSASNISQATVDGYKASISGARTSISTAISNMSGAEEKLNTAQSALTLAQNTLSLKQGGNTPEQISAQNAIVMQNNAQVQSVQAQLAKMTLRSPLNGVVTKQDAKVGEIVTPGKAVISVISDSDLEIEADVSEINIGKVAVGNPVDITLDAFPGQKFLGTVTCIEPAETIIDGVVNYKVTVTFSDKYPQIKSGLTTNLVIKTAQKAGVLRVPQYALIRKDNAVYVSKQMGRDDFAQTQVTTGIVGEDGYVEVLTGLSAGDVVDLVSK